MSEVEISSKRVSKVSFVSRESVQDAGNILAEQVINNSLFKLLLKDIIHDLMKKTQNYEEKDEQIAQPSVPVDIFIDEIGSHLMMIAKTEANKQVKETQKFLNEMYEHKVRQLEDKFEEIIEKKIKEIQERIEKSQYANKTETSLLSHKQLIQIPEQINQIYKRAQLKEKILNTANNNYIPDITNQSISSDSSGTEINFEKLTDKVKQIQQNLKYQLKMINIKIATIKTQCRTQLDQTEATIKEQLNSGFQGIWNVISNLEKRMITI